VLKAGAVYLPLDPDYPPARLAYMLENSACSQVITETAHQTLFAAVPALKVWEIAALLDGDQDAPLALPRAPDALTFVIYTSGSTGAPKGVMLAQRGFVNMICDNIARFGLSPADRLLQFASTSFDASLDEIFSALLAGATLVLVSRQTIDNTEEFIQYVTAQQVTTAILPPVYLHLLERHPLPSVTKLMTVGEAPDRADAEFYARSRRYFNGYGPTEGSICAALYELPPHQSAARLPVGTPTANTRIYVLDPQLALLPVGVVGEICLAGVGVALGYLHHPALTQASFMDDPFYPGERLYKTGDLGRWRADGVLEFLGRRDEQIKIAGHRIELTEIAAQLQRHPEIQEAAVLKTPQAAGLSAYFSRAQRIELWPSIAEFFVYDDVVYHSMAGDETRNQHYRTAFARLSGKTVVEIGPGPEVILSRLARRNFQKSPSHLATFGFDRAHHFDSWRCHAGGIARNRGLLHF